MHAKRFGEVFSLTLMFFLCAGPALASIGTIVDVRPGATVTAGGSTQRINVGMKIDSGDVIKTDSKGIVQLIFVDDTKMAVGPNARMVVNASMMRGNNRARNFAVKALGGSFRFISGKSDSNAYSIETPNATMGIRGTAFDIWVDGSNHTAIALLEGRVEMCKSGGECTVVTGQCSLAAANRGGAIERPSENRQAAQMISAGFPFIQSPNMLTKQFRAKAGGCDHIIAFNDKLEKPVSVKPQLPAQEPPEPPAQEPPEPPAPEPPAPSSGFPGLSGHNGGPSAGKGNSISDGQHGTGTGKGQGATNRSNKGNGSGRANKNSSKADR